MTEPTEEQKREPFPRAASNMGITEEEARTSLREMAQTSDVQTAAERLQSLLEQEGDAREN
jgi:hypothetical protein